MKTILVIGIGAGNPDHLTVEAIAALNRADVVFVPDKGAEKAALSALRREICRRFLTRRPFRTVEARVPERDAAAADYRAAVSDLNAAKRDMFGRVIAEAMADGECGAFLVWGDPSLYDSTIRNLRALQRADGHGFRFEIVPGISSIQVLAARHGMTLNRVGRPVLVTTGRKLAEGFPAGMDTVVVMLDGEATFRHLADRELDIFWGAYLGMPEEILVSGRLRDVSDEILRRRAEARAAHGWIMDSYILRRPDPDED